MTLKLQYDHVISLLTILKAFSSSKNKVGTALLGLHSLLWRVLCSPRQAQVHHLNHFNSFFLSFFRKKGGPYLCLVESGNESTSIYSCVFTNYTRRTQLRAAPSEPSTRGKVCAKPTGAVSVDDLVLRLNEAQVLSGVRNTSFSVEKETNCLLW